MQLFTIRATNRVWRMDIGVITANSWEEAAERLGLEVRKGSEFGDFPDGFYYYTSSLPFCAIYFLYADEVANHQQLVESVKKWYNWQESLEKLYGKALIPRSSAN